MQHPKQANVVAWKSDTGWVAAPEDGEKYIPIHPSKTKAEALYRLRAQLDSDFEGHPIPWSYKPDEETPWKAEARQLKAARLASRLEGMPNHYRLFEPGAPKLVTAPAKWAAPLVSKDISRESLASHRIVDWDGLGPVVVATNGHMAGRAPAARADVSADEGLPYPSLVGIWNRAKKGSDGGSGAFPVGQLLLLCKLALAQCPPQKRLCSGLYEVRVFARVTLELAPDEDRALAYANIEPPRHGSLGRVGDEIASSPLVPGILSLRSVPTSGKRTLADLNPKYLQLALRNLPAQAVVEVHIEDTLRPVAVCRPDGHEYLIMPMLR